MAATVADAIREAFRALGGGERTPKEIKTWIDERYPGRWKDVSTAMADLTSPGSPSSGYRADQRFLERVRPGVYRVR